MDMFWFIAGACVGALVIIFAIIGMALWSACCISSRARQWEASEYSTEDDYGRTIVVGDDHPMG